MYNTLSIINRGLIENKKNVELPNVKKSLIFSKILYNQGIILSYIIKFNKIKIQFNVVKNKLVFNKFINYKKFNKNKFINYKQLKRMYFLQKKILILTTPIGIISSEIALKFKVGGCVLAELI